MEWTIIEELQYLISTVEYLDIPFVVTLSIYFLNLIFAVENIWLRIIIKCAPNICLLVFIYLHDDKKLSRGCKYSRLIFLGLIFSIIGDGLMELDLFAYGMFTFGLAHCFYSTAFGLKYVKLWIGIVLIVPTILVLALIVPKIDDPIIVVGLPIYSILLFIMCWRAMARVDNTREDHLYVTKIICAAGSILFVISDSIIAVHKFHTEVPYRTYWIMNTYYIAQFSIALSIVKYPRGVTIRESRSQRRRLLRR